MSSMATSSQPLKKFTTFWVGNRYFGIEVLQTQEVTGSLPIIPVPLAPAFICGLINLRGQIATAIDLQTLFEQNSPQKAKLMSVVCRVDGNLVSLIVDSIGDVVEVNESQFEMTPETVAPQQRKYISGIYKLNQQLLSVFDLGALALEL